MLVRNKNMIQIIIVLGMLVHVADLIKPYVCHRMFISQRFHQEDSVCVVLEDSILIVFGFFYFCIVEVILYNRRSQLVPLSLIQKMEVPVF